MVARDGKVRPMKLDLYIDGMLSGTGLRDAVEGGYVKPEGLGISGEIVAALVAWQRRYEDAHFASYPAAVVSELDAEGLVLRDRIQSELPDRVVGYFSNGLMERID